MNRRSLLLAVAVAVAVAVAAAAACSAVWASCGSIPFVKGAKVHRRCQRAVTLFDGREQVLQLSTDLRADRPTEVLEVLPFPSKPEITDGDGELFPKACQFIEDRLAERQATSRGESVQLHGLANGEFHRRIPVGETTVVCLQEGSRFVAWVRDYLHEAGVDEPAIPKRMAPIARDCIRDGFTWFAFNVIELGPEPVARKTVQYRFATNRLYYPLRIMGGESGETTIRVVLVSPRLVHMPDRRSGRAVLLHQPIPVGESELDYLSGGLADFFRDHPQQLRLWEIKGSLGKFKRDVWADWF